MAARRLNSAPARAWLGALVGRRAPHSAASTAGRRFIFFEIPIAGIVLDANAKPALNVDVVCRPISGVCAG
jgi:hypothetical protein